MKQDTLLIFGVGILAQVLFAARMLVQWFQSEKAGKPLSPVLFWQLSLFGAILFFIYGVLRHDFAIVLGQLLVYFIYIRNLHLKDQWSKIGPLFQWLVYLIPIASLIFLFSGAPGNIFDLLGNDDISLSLKIWGVTGQLIFTFRFVIQWIESEKRKESILSKSFWIVSLLGSTMLIIYAIFRLDPILFLGQAGGTIFYFRNLVLGKRAKLQEQGIE